MNIQITSVPIIRSPEFNKINLIGNEIRDKDSEDQSSDVDKYDDNFDSKAELPNSLRSDRGENKLNDLASLTEH